MIIIAYNICIYTFTQIFSGDDFFLKLEDYGLYHALKKSLKNKMYIFDLMSVYDICGPHVHRCLQLSIPTDKNIMSNDK